VHPQRFHLFKLHVLSLVYRKMKEIKQKKYMNITQGTKISLWMQQVEILKSVMYFSCYYHTL